MNSPNRIYLHDNLFNEIMHENSSYRAGNGNTHVMQFSGPYVDFVGADINKYIVVLADTKNYVYYYVEGVEFAADKEMLPTLSFRKFDAVSKESYKKFVNLNNKYMFNRYKIVLIEN